MISRNLGACGLGALLLTCTGARGIAADSGSSFLWEVGVHDGDDKEFALAPSGHQQFKQDGFFVVGQSDPKKDWPYAHPGPVDAWAGGRPHTFNVVFGLGHVPEAGECTLRVQLVDTHSRANPQLSIRLNAQTKLHQTPPGGGDDSIFGQVAKGKAHAFSVVFPVSVLKTGINELSITTTSGSWILYDWVGLEAPAGTELSGVKGSAISLVSSAPVLVERNGRLMQLVDVDVRHFGPEASATLEVSTAGSTNVTLTSGAHRVSMTVPPVQAATKLNVSLSVQQQKVAESEVVLKPVRKWEVYLLPHSHVDIGYTHVQTDVEKAQWRYIEMGIEAARKSAAYPPGCRFKWNTEVLWAVDSYLKQATPEKKQAFYNAVKSGWVGLDGLYGNELTGLCRPEELIRLLSFGAGLSRQIGVPIESAMITDVPGYTWGIVPAFAQAGLKYFSIGPNGGDRIGHTIAAWGDKPFWWVGPNGKDKVLVWMTGTGYYRVFQSAQMLENYLSGLESKGYPYDMVQVRHCLGDNGAPDVDFAETVKQWNATYAYPKLIISTTAEMFHAFEKRYGEKLPVAKGDFTPYWEDGAGSSARETALNRASAERLTQTETLYALLAPKAYAAADFHSAWREVLLYDEHTWGAHNSISEPDAPFVKSQWAIKQANALDGDKKSRKLLEQAGSLGPAATESGAIDVFNTCSWIRTDLVTLSPALAMPGDKIVDDKGRTVRSQRLSSGELVFVAEKVPPFAAKRFVLKAGVCDLPISIKSEETSLISPEFSIRLDPKSGGIVSLVSRSLKKDLAEPSSGGINEYWYLPGSDLKELKRAGSAKVSLKESGPVLASLLVESEAPGCRRLSREVRLVPGLPWVEVINIVDKLPVRAKEGVHFGFSFNVSDPHVTMDVPWAIVRPEVDQIPGACKNWFTVQRWVDISNQKYGVTWANPDAPLVELGAITANLIGSLSDPAAWLNHITPSQTIYSWAMNNHWHTNYRAEQEGPTTFKYYIWPHAAASGQEESARFGTAMSQPLIPVPGRRTAPRRPRLMVDSSRVMVSALKPSEDGRAIVLRLSSVSRKPEYLRLKWSEPIPTRISLSDASERPGSPVGRNIEVPAYGLLTLRVEFD